MITTVLDTHADVVAGIDRPEAADMAWLLNAAMRFGDAHRSLAVFTLSNVTDGWATPEGVARASQLVGYAEAGATQVMEDAQGTALGPAAERLTARLDEAGALAQVETALGTSSSDIASLMPALHAAEDVWMAFQAEAADAVVATSP